MAPLDDMDVMDFVDLVDSVDFVDGGDLVDREKRGGWRKATGRTLGRHLSGACFQSVGLRGGRRLAGVPAQSFWVAFWWRDWEMRGRRTRLVQEVRRLP